MTTRTTLTTRVEALERQLAQVRADLERLGNLEARLPATDASMVNGTVVRWRMQFHTAGITYTYAAVKAGGGWYVTGRDTTRPKSWDELVAFMTDRGTLLSLDIATSWDPII